MLIGKNGDIFETDAQVIGHGVNIRGLMGAGIAKQIAKKFPDVKKRYQKACHDGWFDSHGVQFLEPLDASKNNAKFYIANIFTQVNPGRHAQYELIDKNVREALQRMSKADLKSLALPRIGSGIGGLDEDKVEQILQKLSAEFNHIQMELWTYHK